MAGTTGEGKSRLARAMALSAPPPRLVISPNDDTITALPGAETFRDPNRPPEDAATARFVPRDPDDRDAYDRVYRWAFSRFPRWVWCDEAGLVAPAQGYPRGANTYVVQGRKRELGHLACHTRPREVARNFIAQAQHVICFWIPLPEDRRHIAELAGIRPQRLEDAIGQLEPRTETRPGGFLWWNQLTRELTICPPHTG